MWQNICHILSEYFNSEYQIKEKHKLKGGDVNYACSISNGKDPIFIKYNTPEKLSIFKAEADQLALLDKSKTVRVPKVFGIGKSKNHSFILLEYLPQKPLDAHNAYLLGQQLASLHKWIEQPQFGLDFDNDLATIPQPNAWQKRWNVFFSEQRIGWLLLLAKEKSLTFGNIDDIVELVKNKLHHHQPQPSLLHGDLWPANCGLSAQGPLIYDPASYWGDRECDLAMLPYYSYLPPQLYDGYQSIWPLPIDFTKRLPVYQLYYHLNRAVLFGGEYIQIAQNAINTLLSEQVIE